MSVPPSDAAARIMRQGDGHAAVEASGDVPFGIFGCHGECETAAGRDGRGRLRRNEQLRSRTRTHCDHVTCADDRVSRVGGRDCLRTGDVERGGGGGHPARERDHGIGQTYLLRSASRTV